MSKQFIQVDFSKTFDFESFVHEYREEGITNIEQAARYEKFRHDEQLSSPEEILAYADSDYEATFQVVELGDVREDGSLEAIQPDVGGLVVVTTEYMTRSADGKTVTTQKYTRIYRRTVNKNEAEDSNWHDYYQDVSQAYVAGVAWSTILVWMKNLYEDQKRTIEIMEPRPLHWKSVFIAPEQIIEIYGPDDEEKYNAQHVTS